MNKNRYDFLVLGLIFSISPPIPKENKEIPYAKIMTPQQKRIIIILAIISIISLIVLFALVFWAKGYI